VCSGILAALAPWIALAWLNSAANMKRKKFEWNKEA